MKKIKFTIAIPTFNRLSRLKKAIDSVLSQKISNQFEFNIAISNTYSNDSTYDYLNGLKKKKEFIIHNERKKEDKSILSQFINFRNLAKIIPADTDWVWWLGDDDYLYKKESIKIVTEKINESANNKNIPLFIHACHPERASSKGQCVNDTIMNLCEKFGYHEMLGWMSSIILKKDAMIKVLNESTKNMNYLDDNKKEVASCFSHSASILKNFHNRKGLFLDLGLVCNQDEKQTDDTKKRWENDNVCNRYFKIIDDFFEIRDVVKIKTFQKPFFRYHGYHIWDHLGEYLIRKAIIIGRKCIDEQRLVNEHEYELINNRWMKIVKIAELLDDLETQKLLGFTFQSGLNYTNLYFNSLSEEVINDFLLKFRQILCITNYKKTIVNE